MSTAVLPDWSSETSPRLKARIAGAFWLSTFLTGAFAMFVAAKLVEFGNPAATATNISAHEVLFRWGLAADLVATLCYVGATLFVYEILKAVNKSVSMLAAFFSLLGCANSAVAFVFHLAPLVALGGESYLSAFTLVQLQALALTFLRIRVQANGITFAFFGLHCLLVGCLIFRSTFLPRLVGVLMVSAGLGWLTFSLAGLLSPPLVRTLTPYIFVPGMLGEGSLTLWLLVVGLNVEHWKTKAGAHGGGTTAAPHAPADSIAR